MHPKPLELELRRLPGGRMHISYDPATHDILLSFSSPCFGALTFSINDQAAASLEHWFHRARPAVMAGLEE